jgi:hypothetical protein
MKYHSDFRELFSKSVEKREENGTAAVLFPLPSLAEKKKKNNE